jgi:GNAT superfamily N-acetyltransferase
MISTEAPLPIEKFDKARHNRDEFTCGFRPIDNFLKKSLSEQIAGGLLAAYVAAVEGRVIGFYTLSAHMIFANAAPDLAGRHRVPSIPAWYMKALAVDLGWQGRNIGTALMVNAMRRASRLSDEVGASALVLDVLQDDAADRRRAFYLRMGFREMNDPENPARMFIAMKDIRAALSP